MKRYYVFAFLMLFYHTSFGREKKILFIGNSLTSVNDMPQLLRQMLTESNIDVEVQQVTENGSDLTSHAKQIAGLDGSYYRIGPSDTAVAVKKILREHWDMVILQEATWNILTPDIRASRTIPAIMFFDSLVRSGSGKVILYQNYTGQKFPARNCIPNGPRTFLFKALAFDPNTQVMPSGDSSCSPVFYNRSAEFDCIEKEYDSIANSISAGVARVGYYFNLCMKAHPDIQLYASSDDDHPSKEGAYLMACVFFRQLTGKKLSSIHFSANLPENVAVKIRNLVDSVS
jgi:hypothetical protein